MTGFSAFDHAMMRRALALAEKGLYTTTPNPRVGCVVTQQEKIVGEGWHERAGAPHAEIVALENAGSAAAGATVYVTLEPCNHHGRTPPCVNRLIESRVKRVVAAMRDPNPEAAHGGNALEAAGIRFEHGLMQDEARELNIGFVSRMTRGRPWVRLKVAATLDGRSALADGTSKWITGAEARRDGHRWRARACAILTGIGTVKADDPRLTVLVIGQPLRVSWTPPRTARASRRGNVLIFRGHERTQGRQGRAAQQTESRSAAHARRAGASRRERAARRGRVSPERLARARRVRRRVPGVPEPELPRRRRAGNAGLACLCVPGKKTEAENPIP
jgi:riboflavin biosynthesis protein RibD